MTAVVSLVLAVTSLLTLSTVAKVIDLSHKHGPDTFMSLYGAPGYNHTVAFSGDFMPGVFVEMGNYFTSEHGGTHMDAPRHFTQGGTTLDEIPLEKTIADGVMIDCIQDVKTYGDNYTVPLQKILDWESDNGQIPEGAAVLFNFGWSPKFSNEALYRGSTDLADSSTYKFPSVSVEAGQWLVDNRKIYFFGTDTLSIDAYTTDFPLHQVILPKGGILVENLRDLDKLPARGFRFHSSPVKFVGLSGAQVRAFAMTYDGDGNNAGICQGSLVLSLIASIIVCVFVV